MIVYNTEYVNIKKLKNYIIDNNIINNKNILLQIFTARNKESFIQELIDNIKQCIPHIKIIGSTTSGEIIDNKVNESSTILSFSIFKHTEVNTHFSDNNSDSFECGIRLINKFNKDLKPKVAIAFTDNTYTNGEYFFNALFEYSNDLIIAGGVAADNGDCTNTLVFNEEIILSKGAVVALLYNDDLIVNTDVNLGWHKIGKKSIITKATDDVVYTIDNIKAVDFYKKYLGDNIVEDFDVTGGEFPLIIHRDKRMVARVCVGKNDDCSLRFSGNFKSGDIVTFGYANMNSVFKGSEDIYNRVHKNSSESIFIYSCRTRKLLLKDKIAYELQALSSLAPISGFFTCGEFYSYNKPKRYEFLNETMTVLSLSEDKKDLCYKKDFDSYNHPISTNATLEALTNLVSQTSLELEELNSNLECKIEEKTKDVNDINRELVSLLASYDKYVIYSSIDLRGNITNVSDAFCKISGYSREELIGKNHNIVRHPDISPSVFENIWKLLIQKKSFEVEVKYLKKDAGYFWVNSFFAQEYDKEGNHVGYTAVREDITHRKEVEALHAEIEETQKEVIFTMGSIAETRSKETRNHVKRVAEYSKLLALYCGLDKKEIELLSQASPMHDIGKIAIPDNILNKPSKHSVEEFKIMKTHSILGYEMLKHSKRPLLHMASIIAYEHHEKWDGSGYPKGLKGTDISIYGRITAITDVFDALGSERVYKKSWDDDKIFSLFKEEKGKHFDPNLVDIFFENIDEFLSIRDKFKDIK